jgi:hypothetical protein
LNLIDEATAQLLSVTLPNDTSQLKFLRSLESVTSPIEKISSFVNFLVQKVTTSSLETARMFKEMQHAKEQLRLSENRESRLCLHLQQNVKLLGRVATNEGDTTLVQEAAQNIASVSGLDFQVPPNYLKQIKQALSAKRDRLVGVEVLELLKQEISINSILRKQIEQLFSTSHRLQQAVETIKQEFKRRGPDRVISELKKSESLLTQIAGFLKCPVAEIEATVTRLIEENSSKQRSLDLLKKKLADLTKQFNDQQGEFEIAKHQLQQREESDKRGQKVRMQLLKELGLQCKATTELDALIFAASRAVPIVESHRVICSALQSNPGQVLNVIDQIRQENEKLKRVIEQNRALMANQAETIQALQDQSWKKWAQSPDSLAVPHDDAASHSSDSNSQMDLETEAQFSQLKGLNEQFTSIERELDELKQEMDAQFEPK